MCSVSYLYKVGLEGEVGQKNDLLTLKYAICVKYLLFPAAIEMHPFFHTHKFIKYSNVDLHFKDLSSFEANSSAGRKAVCRQFQAFKSCHSILVCQSTT